MKLFVLFLLSFSSLFGANFKYSKFVDSQIKIIQEMNKNTATKQDIDKLVKKQNILFENKLNELMSNKKKYILDSKLFEGKIFTLKKVISINKKADNRYAVLRDEVALKSYMLLRDQNRMFKEILIALDEPTIDMFEEKFNAYVNKNQEQIQLLYKKDYLYLLLEESESTILKSAKKNVRDFYALKEFNSAMVAYLYNSENRMYRLNKYSKYHMIDMAIYVNSIDFVKVINPMLEKYGLNVIKLIFIALLSLFILFFRKIIYVTLEKYILKIDFLEKYSKQILVKIRKTIETVIIIININMIIYVYNDFSSNEAISRVFNIIYGFYFTLLLYKVINTIANIKLSDLEKQESKVKNDLINVSIKIVNFIIIMIGLLIVMFFAGVNLTAVLSGLGIGGFAVAFAAKDTISNFFGTLSILFSNVFSQGDWIEIDGKEGVVIEIGLRVTTLRTFDNALIAIPNGTFASKDVKNWNKRVLGRRIKMSLGLKYDSKKEDVKNAVNEIREMLIHHPAIATKDTKYEHLSSRGHMARLVSKNDLRGVKSTLLVYLDEFSDSSINILIYCFTKSVMWEDWLIAKEDVMYKMMDILERNNLEFAFPSLSIYNENI